MMSNENDYQKSPTALKEEEILKFWKEIDAFKKTLEKDSPKGEYVFFEGPPTANGKPGIHHLEARAFKDAIPRYKTMQGFHVRRKAGWDTHGLPVELQVEKELGLVSKKEIEKYGISPFNKKCRESVLKYINEWSDFTDRIGYWVDKESAYFTFNPSYMESVWNIIKKVDEQNLLYKDYKIVPWCPRCGTGLSSHELAQGYQDDKDLSLYAKFKVVGQDNAYLLAWTTTPWTLPGNVALAVGEEIDYVKVKVGDEIFILAKSRLLNIAEGYEILEEIKGKDLIGLEYEPLYVFLKDNLPSSEKAKLSQAFKVCSADFVTTEDGTGIVHIAPMYGPDDFNLGTKIGLPKYHIVNDDGTFKDFSGFLSGKFVKNEETAVDIIKDLANRGLLFKKEKYEHSYPHCWRCKTPLIYFARDSWYIRMSDLRDRLISENEKINWEPDYIKNGRFGEWLKDVKDWALSRERYWGTPLPVWLSEDGTEKIVVGSVEDIKKHTKKSGNKYFVMRHGEAEQNIKNILSGTVDAPYHLTDKGREEVLNSAESLKDKKITKIICSPFVRTKETAEIVSGILGLSKDSIILDERLGELNFGVFNEKDSKEYIEYFNSFEEQLEKEIPNGETHNDLRKRVGDCLYDVDKKFSNENILFITHGGPTWALLSVSSGSNKKEAIEIHKNHYPSTAEVKELNFSPIPHNDLYELDLHKPYIDEIQLFSDKGTPLYRAKEVMDVWLDSGAMPFAQDHYPFVNEKLSYPADFISEAIDQTRGWFYTLHAVGVLLGKGSAYKNVICLGHLNDKEGKKMSKSIGNVINPIEMMNKYGVDALRLWMYSVNQPGEPKNFDEKTVDEIVKKNFNLLSNVLTFYDLYREKDLESNDFPVSKNVLDIWILARLSELVEDGTKNLESYKLLEPVRTLRDFIDDLSTWYVRRSRERLREGDKDAKQTLYFVLKTISKYIAPFAPFYAESLFQSLRNKEDEESVHLESWPNLHVYDKGILEMMEATRKIVEVAMRLRSENKIIVRQPLAKLSYEFISSRKIEKEFESIIADEVNVKIVENSSGLDTSDYGGVKVSLDTEITPELKEEGEYRELVRKVQDLRKIKNLKPQDKVELVIFIDDDSKQFIEKFKEELMKTTSLKSISYNQIEGEEVLIGDKKVKLELSF